MRKIFYFLLVVMLVIGMLQIVLPLHLLETTAAPPPPDDGVNGAYTQYLTGNWNITGNESYSDEIIVLSGNLTIFSGGSLTLKNVTLAMNCTTENGTYTIEVLAGGTLIITDGDNNPATTNDRSNITDSPFDTDDNSPVDYRTSVRVYDGATVSLNNSIFSECGFPETIWDSNTGVYIETDNINIQNCTFENNWYGLYISRGENHRIGYNEFRYCNYQGVSCYWSTYIKFYNNEIHHNDDGMFMSPSYSSIFNNIIHNNSNVFTSPPTGDKHGFVFWYGDYTKIYNNTIKHNGGSGSSNLEIINCDGLEVYDNFISDPKPGGTWPVNCYSLKGFTFINNTIINSDGYGVYIGFSGTYTNFRINNNNVSNHSRTGLYISGWGSPTNSLEANNNTLTNNEIGLRLNELRTYEVHNNTIRDNTDYGVYVNDVADGNFTNNTVNATKFDFGLRDSNGPMDTVFEVVNCTCDANKTDIQSGRPLLEIKNFLHVKVFDKNSIVRGATVTIRNNTNAIVFQGETNENGSINYIKIMNQSTNHKGTLFYDSHNITATLNVYTAYGEIEPSMNRTQSVNVYFDIDLPPLAPRDISAIGNDTHVDLSWRSSQSGDRDHYLIYRNGTGSTWVEIYNSSIDPPTKLRTSWTHPQGASTPSTYSYKVIAVDKLWKRSEDSNIAYCGNWVVADEQVVVGLNVDLNGTLNILPTGNLTLKNCKIQFMNNISLDGGYGVEVQPGGKLSILDGDNDPATTADQTRISMIGVKKNSFFLVESADFTMRNSKLLNFGFDTQSTPRVWEIDSGHDVLSMGEPRNRGLYIHDSVVNIESNIFSDNFVSVLLDDIKWGKVNSNTFSDNTFGLYLNNSNYNTISDNVFNNQDGFPIYLLNSKNNSVSSNTITNPSSTTAGIGLYEIGCKGNSIFSNNITDGENGIFAYYCGIYNNISYNNIDQSDFGINIEQTSWCSLFDNNFDTITNVGCLILNSDFARVIGGKADNTKHGYYFNNSRNSVIAKLRSENASISGITFWDLFNMKCIEISVKNCNRGISVIGGDLIQHKFIDMADCNIGFLCSMYPTDIYIFNSSLVDNIDQAVVVVDTEDVIIINCTFDATIYNFNLAPGGVSLINTTYNQTKVRLFPGSHISLYWFLDVRVYDWYGNPASNINVQIREVLGTLVFNGPTDSNGYVRWRMLLQRNQYSTSNESFTPYYIRSNMGKHWGSTTTFLNLSLLEIVNLKNTGPSVSNLLLTPTNPTTTSKITLEYTYSDNEDDPENNTYIKWYVDGMHKAAYNNQTDILSTSTNKGETWYCEIIPNDDATFGTPMTSMPVTIKNTKPKVTNVAIIQTLPRSSEDLHINYSYSDIDNDLELGSLHKWMVNDGTGWEYSGQDAEILNASFTKKGERWKCEVKPYDGDDYGDAVQSPAITIGNAQPEVSNLKIKPNNPGGNESLYIEYDYYDLDNDLESESIIKWFKDGIEQQQLANKSSVGPENTKKNDRWHYSLIPFDGSDYGKKANSEFVVIGNTPPKVANIVIQPLNPTTSDDLTVKYDFSDDDGDNESFDTRIEWLRKRIGDFEFSHTGLKVSTLSSVYTFKSEIWTCEVTTNDGLSYGTTVRCDVEVTIGNSKPMATNGYITPDNPTTTTTLIANYQFTDPDNDLESGSVITWYRDQDAVPELNNKMTVSNDLTKKGEVWYFSVQPMDGKDLGEIVKSSNIIIQNSPPTAKNVTITPKSPTGKNDLTANYNYFDEDGDIEGSPEIIWFENGIHQPEYDNLLIVDSEAVKKGKNWHFDVRVFDGTDFSDWISSTHPLIGNSYVVADSITPSVGTVKTVIMNESEKQIFQVIASDPDNDDIDYEWLLDGILIGSDFQFVFETSYDGEFDEGTYELMLMFGDHDTDKSDWTLIEWEIIVSDVNRPPILEDKAPISTNLVVIVSKSLKFSVQASDPDVDDKLSINWFFDGVDTGTPGSSYAYVGRSEHLAGTHQVKVEISDGEVVLDYSWNVTVEEEKEDAGERLYGQTYDWWGLIGTLITSIIGASLFLFGFFRMKKKKSKLREHLDQIEEIVESDKPPFDKEMELKELKKEIKKEFSSESIIENHYIILMQHVDNAIGEIRTGLLEERVAMPDELKVDVQEVLGDGIVTKDEFSEIVNRIRTTKELTPIEKNKLTGMLSRWMMEGKTEEPMLPRSKIPQKKTPIKKSSIEQEEDDFELD